MQASKINERKKCKCSRTPHKAYIELLVKHHLISRKQVDCSRRNRGNAPHAAIVKKHRGGIEVFFDRVDDADLDRVFQSLNAFALVTSKREIGRWQTNEFHFPEVEKRAVFILTCRRASWMIVDWADFLRHWVRPRDRASWRTTPKDGQVENIARWEGIRCISSVSLRCDGEKMGVMEGWWDWENWGRIWHIFGDRDGHSSISDAAWTRLPCVDVLEAHSVLLLQTDDVHRSVYLQSLSDGSAI
jgi:hypothetical protein